AESLVGKYLSKSQKELRELIKRIFIWGFGLGGVFSIAIFLFPQNILSFFTNNEKVLQIALGYMIYTILAPLINSFSYLWDGIYLGASRAKALRNSMLIAVFLIYLPLYFLTRSYLGGDSLWIAMVIFMVARGFLLFIQAEREIFSIGYVKNA
ncbi:MAG: MATE family efflux transporter, partial [Epsilonproteobacteria bacterium]|nr:MATE family efflux transporter [Campylobacterota bacterium]